MFILPYTLKNYFVNFKSPTAVKVNINLKKLMFLQSSVAALLNNSDNDNNKLILSANVDRLLTACLALF